MKLTIWQFLGIVLALVLAYCAWNFWGKDLDQNGLIRKMNGGITGDDTSNVKTTTAPSGGGADGAGGTGGKAPW